MNQHPTPQPTPNHQPPTTPHHQPTPTKTNHTPLLLTLPLLLLTLPTNAQTIHPQTLLQHQIRNINIRPAFGISQTYNDNIYYRGNQTITNHLGQTITKQNDHITHLTGRLQIRLGRPTHNHITANYTYTHNLHHQHTQQNAGNHTLNLQSHIQHHRLNIQPHINLANTRTILSGSYRTAAQQTQPIQRNTLQTRLRARIQTTPKTHTTTTLNYRLNNIQDTLNLYDSDDLSIRQNIGTQIRPKITLSAAATIGKRTLTPNNNTPIENDTQNYIGAGLTLQANPTHRLNTLINIGIRRLTYKNNQKPFHTPVLETTLNYKLGKNITTHLHYTRTTFIGIQTTNSSGTTDHITLAITKPITPRKNWILTTSATLNHQKWNNTQGISANRTDQTILTTATLQYRIQEWLHCNLTYTHQQFTSTLSQNPQHGTVDYTVNTANISLNIGY